MMKLIDQSVTRYLSVSRYYLPGTSVAPSDSVASFDACVVKCYLKISLLDTTEKKRERH